VLDSNFFDELVKSPEAYQATRAAVEGAATELLVDTMVLGQLGATKDIAKRTQMLAYANELCRRVEHGGAGYGIGPYGAGPYGGARPAEMPIATAVIGNATNNGTMADSAIAATAHYEGAVLVTRDGALRKKATAEGVEVLSPAEFFTEIGFDTAEAASP